MDLLSRRISLSGLCLLGVFLVGCSGSDTGPSYGEWTMKETPLHLTEDLLVSETDAFYFGSVTDVDVTSDGRMVVADREANNVKVLSPDGTLVDTLGGI